MTRRRIYRCVAIAVWIGFAMLASAAGSEDYKIIVHPGNPATAIDRQFLRDAYLRKTNDWAGGAEILPIDLTARYSVRERFGHDVLKKTPSQLKNYWNQQIFSGKGVPPPEADTADSVVSYVLANPGAVGYVPLDADTREAKVIKVK